MRALAILSAVAATFAPALAQNPVGSGTQAAPTTHIDPNTRDGLASAPTRSTLYVLAPKATWVQGCFLPCACPLIFANGFRGTFELRRVISPNPDFQAWIVEDVNWLVSIGASTRYVSGNGHYTVGTQGTGTVQRLTLDLRIGDADSVFFDSGLVPGGSLGDAPPIGLGIDFSDQQCFDVLIGVNAVAANPVDVVPFDMDPESAFTRGCFHPCTCPVLLYDLGGRFDLVPLGVHAGAQEFALVGIDWVLGDPREPAFFTRGAGIYRETGTVHEIDLGLRIEGVLDHWSSGPMDGSSLPDLSISAAQNDYACFDQVFRIEATPRL